jgi:hypothetical protein
MSKIFLSNFCARDRPCLIANEARTVMGKESLVMLCLFWSGWNAPRHNNDLWGTIPLASAVASQTKRTLSKVIHMLIYPLLIHCLIERQGRVADSTSSVALILAVCWTRKGFICTTKYFVWYIFRNNSYTL